MTLIKRSTPQIPVAFGDWDSFVDSWFDRWAAPRAGALASLRGGAATLFSPPVEIIQGTDEIELHAELPGVKIEDINVTVHEDTLTLKGSKKTESEAGDGRYRYSERQYGEFTRTFQLPATVDSTKVKAEFKDGILRVHMPLAEEAKPKAIEIEVK